MSLPQSSLFVEQTAVHLHVEFSLAPGIDDPSLVRALSAAREAATWLGGPNVVWGFAPSLWRRLSDGRLPEDVCDFVGVGPGNAAGVPVTQSDIWLWVHGNEYPAVWRTGYDVVAELTDVAAVDGSIRGYKAPDSRDPTGFIDGTENPVIDEAMAVALIPDGQPGAGGSPVLVQKWVHDLAAFEALPVAAQQDVIGRTKPDSVQLPDDVMPVTSHVSRNTITDDEGHERHIFRRNTPFADLHEVGTVFIGASREPARIDLMLERMFGVSDDGLHDELTRYSTPVTGSYYFVPAMTELTAVFGSIGDDEESADDPERVTVLAASGTSGAAAASGAVAASGPVGSDLGIGSLLGRD